MGIPKFFRFISDRYPCINEVINKDEIPVYENLYIDMNSIIHICSHPDNSDIHFSIEKTEFSNEDIFKNIERYVQIIFQIVRPTELLFLAFDGVAPRAKINQQRSNRFRAAKNFNKCFSDTKLSGEFFDANCITPGTIFMTELVDHLKHFIAFKISTDAMWQNCKVILSGCQVPGEGEHKIMQFIRHQKLKPNYDCKKRHCLYSLDADLIILGLCLHEQYFSLLREKYTFGKKHRMLTPEESDFLLLNLSLVREYLNYEFTSLKSQLKFEFNLEKIIDDWILIVFLVGNDFIPQLPKLNIVDGTLPLLYQVYIKILPHLDGYINEAGQLNFERFEKFTTGLAFIEKKVFDLIQFEKVTNLKKYHIDIIKRDLSNFKIDKILNYEADLLVVQDQKEYYYKNKLQFDYNNESHICTLVQDYIKTLQWTLNYYYNGCCSWSWYYPYHYAPLISDFKKIKNIGFKFDMSTPFLPLQHLLAVIPPVSKHLLPKPLRFLLTDSESPIADFYPENYDIDINGKTNDWESVVLIPFIDEKRIINVVEQYDSSLNYKERRRNMNGVACALSYTEQNLGEYPVDTVFGLFTNHAQLEHIQSNQMFSTKDILINDLKFDLYLNSSFSRFPTFNYLPHQFELQLIEIKTIAQTVEQIEKIILNILPKTELDLKEIAKDLLGHSIFINWPYLQEAFVIGVTDLIQTISLENYWKKYSENNLRYENISDKLKLKLMQDTKLITEKYEMSKGIHIGDVKILIYVYPLIGKKYKYQTSGKFTVQKNWSSFKKVFPYQLIVKESHIDKPSIIPYKPITDIFYPSSSCFIIGQPYYGSQATVKSVCLTQTNCITVSLMNTHDPDVSKFDENFFVPITDYKNASESAKQLNICSILINRITGSLKILDGSTYYNIGLRIKYPSSNKELIGFSKYKNGTWFYSNQAIQLIKNYIETFPELFKNLNKNPTTSIFMLADLFPEGLSQLDRVKAWLHHEESSYTTFIEIGTKTLGFEAVTKLERLITNFFSDQEDSKIIEMDVPSDFLFRPSTIAGLVPPDKNAIHKLLDRIVCIREFFTVPLGLKGTIIGIQEKQDKWSNIYEILFDSIFDGGLTLYGSPAQRCYRLRVSDFINISFGHRDANSQNTELNNFIQNTVNSKKSKFNSSDQRNRNSEKSKSQIFGQRNRNFEKSKSKSIGRKNTNSQNPKSKSFVERGTNLENVESKCFNHSDENSEKSELKSFEQSDENFEKSKSKCFDQNDTNTQNSESKSFGKSDTNSENSESKCINQIAGQSKKSKFNCSDQKNRNSEKSKSQIFGQRNRNFEKLKSKSIGRKNTNSENSESKSFVERGTNLENAESKCFNASNENSEKSELKRFEQRDENSEKAKCNNFGQRNKNFEKSKSKSFGRRDTNSQNSESKSFGKRDMISENSESKCINQSAEQSEKTELKSFDQGNGNSVKSKSSNFGQRNRNFEKSKSKSFGKRDTNSENSESKSFVERGTNLENADSKCINHSNENSEKSELKSFEQGNRNFEKSESTNFKQRNRNFEKSKPKIFGFGLQVLENSELQNFNQNNANSEKS